jgi:hypothetical protein
MAVYGSNSLVVKTQKNPIEEPLPDNKSEAMPEYPPSRVMPGGMELKFGPQPGRRYPKGMKNLPWRSWLQNKRPGVKRKKKRSIAELMG